jgi:hypothetical protein
MRQIRLLLLVSGITTLGVVIGWLGGAPFGRSGPFIAATIAGTLAVLIAIRTATSIGWLDRERRKGGSIGGLVGLALASPLASMPMQRPEIMLASAILVGIGVLIGAGRGAAR